MRRLPSSPPAVHHPCSVCRPAFRSSACPCLPDGPVDSPAEGGLPLSKTRERLMRLHSTSRPATSLLAERRPPWTQNIQEMRVTRCVIMAGVCVHAITTLAMPRRILTTTSTRNPAYNTAIPAFTFHQPGLQLLHRGPMPREHPSSFFPVF